MKPYPNLIQLSPNSLPQCNQFAINSQSILKPFANHLQSTEGHANGIRLEVFFLMHYLHISRHVWLGYDCYCWSHLWSIYGCESL